MSSWLVHLSRLFQLSEIGKLKSVKCHDLTQSCRLQPVSLHDAQSSQSGADDALKVLRPYRRIARQLRADIERGDLLVGQQLPTQEALVHRFSVSRATVQRALAELRADGWIDSQQGRGSYVLDRGAQQAHGSATSDAPERALLSLAHYISEAFKEPRVTIDMFSWTAETLNNALADPMRQLQRGELNPESITVRLLLPSPDVSLALPKLVGNSDDVRPLARMRKLMQAQLIFLESTFTSLSQARPDIAQSVVFHSVPITPVAKFYLLNERTALLGLYQAVQRKVDLGGPEPEDIHDMLGVNAMLFPHHRRPDDPDAAESRFVAEVKGWFDSLWDQLSRPLSPFG